MDDQQEDVRTKFDVDKHLIDNVWEDKTKGLRKELLDFQFTTIVKASELSKCLVEVLEIQNFNSESHKSNYLSADTIEKEFWIEIGHGLTPIDCYIEIFLQQMLTNETSKCTIATKSSGDISFTLRLKQIEFGGYYCEQSSTEMFELAKLYKDNGVKIFKSFPLFAQNYFNLAAKCLLPFNPSDDINACDSDLKKEEFEELLQNVYLNIAACLLKQQRYEDTVHVLKYTVSQENPSEKSIYRLAQAFFHLKQYTNAKNTIERTNFKNNKELAQLMTKIDEHLKVDHDEYSNMVKKMFA